MRLLLLLAALGLVLAAAPPASATPPGVYTCFFNSQTPCAVVTCDPGKTVEEFQIYQAPPVDQGVRVLVCS